MARNDNLRPIYELNGLDITRWVEELHPVDNDLDAEGSGRNVLNGLMFRSRVDTKEKWSLKLLTISAPIMSDILKSFYSSGNYVRVKALDAKENRYITKEYYSSSFDKGVQRWDGTQTVYQGAAFNMTER